MAGSRLPLAPASALAERVKGEATYEQVAELAHDFGVSELVVRHKLENHAIASIRDL